MESEGADCDDCGSFPFDYCYSASPAVLIFHSLLFFKRRQHEGAIAFLARKRIGINELFRLAPRMDNFQTVKRFLDHKFKVHLETSSDSGALKCKEKKVLNAPSTCTSPLDNVRT